MILSIPAATLSDKVTIAAGKPETKGWREEFNYKIYLNIQNINSGLTHKLKSAKKTLCTLNNKHETSNTLIGKNNCRQLSGEASVTLECHLCKGRQKMSFKVYQEQNLKFGSVNLASSIKIS